MNKLIREFPRALFISILIFIVLTIILVVNGEATFNNHLKVNFLYTLLMDDVILRECDTFMYLDLL
jgi:hypothetical protein